MTLFTQFGVVVASVAFLCGLAAVVGSFIFLPIEINSPEFRSSFNFRQASVLVTQGMALMFAGLLLGVLCEISKKLDALVVYANDKEQD